MMTRCPGSVAVSRATPFRVLLLSLLALLLVSPGAGAWTIVRDTGTHGQWRFLDQVRVPGGICERRSAGVYLVPNDTARVWARDRTARVDTQKVGARFLAQVRRDGRWVPAASVFGLTTEHATDATPASFAWGGYTFPRGAYRIVLVFLWYGRDETTVVGSVKIRVRVYQGSVGPGNAYCEA